MRSIRAKEIGKVAQEQLSAFQHQLAMIRAPVTVDPHPHQIVKTKHPGVVEIKFVSRTIRVPAVAAIEASHLRQPRVEIGL